MSRPRVLVTGGTGFLGRRLVDRLRAGYQPMVLARRPVDFGAGVDTVAGDLRDDLASIALPDGIAHIVHLAQSRGYRDFPSGAEDVFAVNVGGAWRAVELGRRLGVGSLVVASSGSVYAPSPVPLREDSPLIGDGSFYAQSKLAAELVVTPYRKLLPVHLLRFFFLYGPGQPGEMFLPRLHRQISDGESVVLHGEHGFSCNPLYVDDAASVTLAALSWRESSTFNVAGPERVTVRELASRLGDLVGRAPAFRVEDTEPTSRVADTSSLERVFEGPRTAIADGLARAFARTG